MNVQYQGVVDGEENGDDQGFRMTRDFGRLLCTILNEKNEEH